MTLEIAVGLAHLGGRRLSMPWNDRVGASPGSRPASSGADGQSPSVLDLWEVPIEVVTDEEWESMAKDPAVRHIDWGLFARCVYLADDDPIPHPGVRDFANGRTRYVRVPEGESPVAIAGRPLSFASYFFHATGRTRRELFATLERVRPRSEYRAVASQVVADLGAVNIAHIRRTDLVRGIRAYAGVSPERIADTLTSLFPTDEPLVIATEADSTSSLFDPIRRRFGDVVFLTDVILGDHGNAFRSLPFAEDNALGIITQEVAASGNRFIGTMGSTFTALIHRMRRQRDFESPFWYTADYTPAGPSFADGAYIESRSGRYTWNRIGYAIAPETLAWLREWPEAASSPDDAVDAVADRRGDTPVPIHAVVCTDTNPYGDWQCEFQEHTWARVRQPGELVRLVGCPNQERPPTTRYSRLITTAARNDHPDAPKEYAGFNRLWSLQEWLELEQPSGSILVLDSDFVFRGPIRSRAEPGLVIAQEWFGEGTVDWLRQSLSSRIVADPERIEPFTWPLLIDALDLVRILPRWIELTAELRATEGMWESDMFALVGAIAETDIDVKYENLGAWMNWPEAFVAGAPIIHYCQEVKARDGSPMWHKQRYRPWEPLGVDPNDASLDYCRDLLHLLDEYVRVRSRS